VSKNPHHAFPIHPLPQARQELINLSTLQHVLHLMNLSFFLFQNECLETVSELNVPNSSNLSFSKGLSFDFFSTVHNTLRSYG
jgi:hypothetical protein